MVAAHQHAALRAPRNAPRALCAAGAAKGTSSHLTRSTDSNPRTSNVFFDVLPTLETNMEASTSGSLLAGLPSR